MSIILIVIEIILCTTLGCKRELKALEQMIDSLHDVYSNAITEKCSADDNFTEASVYSDFKTAITQDMQVLMCICYKNTIVYIIGRLAMVNFFLLF